MMGAHHAGTGAAAWIALTATSPVITQLSILGASVPVSLIPSFSAMPMAPAAVATGGLVAAGGRRPGRRALGHRRRSARLGAHHNLRHREHDHLSSHVVGGGIVAAAMLCSALNPREKDAAKSASNAQRYPSRNYTEDT
jgi:hypothetical protein